jgi:ABC-type phosphate/phosphonate transport system substrate-binding protein
MKHIFFAAAVLLASFGLCRAAEEERVTFGVLVWNGKSKGAQQWEAVGRHIAQRLGRPVDIEPLEFKEVLPAAEAGSVHFFTADPSMFVTAQRDYGAKPVLTMKNATVGTDSIGSVIFTAADNQAVNSLSGLQGKKFGALRRWSFAGWQMAEKEFADAGIDVYSFVHTLRFFETPQAVIKAVISGAVDAGTVPTGLLEREAANGEIQMEDVKILEKKFHSGFPYACSTVLYPGFVLARTAAVDDKLANQVAEVLKELSPDDPALKDAGVAGWVDPLDYSGIKELHGQLKGMEAAEPLITSR